MKAIKISVILLLIIIGVVSKATAQPENDKNGQPTNEFQKPMPPPPPVLPGIPNLTKEQSEAIKKLQLSISSDVLPIENDIKEKEAKLNSLTTVKNPEINAIYKVVDDIAVLKVKIAKLQIAHDLDIRKLLTDEQRLIFDRRPKHPVH